MTSVMCSIEIISTIKIENSAKRQCKELLFERDIITLSSIEYDLNRRRVQGLSNGDHQIREPNTEKSKKCENSWGNNERENKNRQQTTNKQTKKETKDTEKRKKRTDVENWTNFEEYLRRMAQNNIHGRRKRLLRNRPYLTTCKQTQSLTDER